MDHFLMKGRLASFRLDGQIRALSPAQMERTGGGAYRAVYPGGLEATLRVGSVMPGALEWMVTLENTGEGNTGRISELLGMDIELPASAGGEVVWRSLEGDSCSGRSFMPVAVTLPVGGAHHVEPARGRSSQETAFPYFDMDCGGCALVCGIGWTGQWQLDMARGRRSVTLRAGQQDSDFYLKPGERARSVRVLVLTGSGVEELRHDFRRMHRIHYSPAAGLGPDLPMPVAVQAFDRYWMRYSSYASEAAQLKCLASAARCAAFDTFWLDAAWFPGGFPRGVGNYRCSDGYPGGLKGISDRAHRSGMKFMVWFEPERVCRGSDTFERFDGHGDWLLDAADSQSDTRLFNLGNPEARQWLLDTLSAFIEENGVDIYRQDFNMDPLAYWRAADGPGRRGLTEMRHVEGLYLLWDALRERFPGLLIDNCASGGRRIDLESCSRSVPLWRSDTACSPDSAEKPVAAWHQNQTLGLSRYIPYHCASTWFEDAYRFRSGTTMGVACEFDFLDDGYDHGAARAAIGELERIRSCWKGDFYALTEAASGEDGWAAYQLHDGDSGFCMVFRRKSSVQGVMSIGLRGIDPRGSYSLSLSDEGRRRTWRILSGRELADGIEVEIPGPMHSVLMEYSEI